MTQKQYKDIFWQYHLWKNTMSKWQKIIFAIKTNNRYESAWEYFIINIYKIR